MTRATEPGDHAVWSSRLWPCTILRCRWPSDAHLKRRIPDLVRRRADFHCSTHELCLAGFFFLGLAFCFLCPSSPIGGEAKEGRPITGVAHVACTSRIMFYLTPTVVSIHRDTPSPRPIIGELGVNSDV